MKRTTYTKYNGNLADDINLEDLMQQLSDYLLDSGFQNPYTQFQELNGDFTMDNLREDTISRVMSEMRRNSSMSDPMSPQSGSVLPHIAKMKKEEDDMDEDERLLNSEEGKKLSSKERRQLRNKVSARAFRSRRKGKQY